MNAFINDLNHRLDAQLLEISRQDTGTIQKARDSSRCVKRSLFQLHSFVTHYTFRDELEEIDFFKTIKPGFLSKYIYHTKIFHIESKRPTGGRHIHQTYLRNEIENLSLLHVQHPEFLQYFRTGESYLDHFYFLRSKEIPSICDDDLTCSMDPQFSTGYDYLVAKIIAYEQLSAWLYSRIDALDTPIQPTETKNSSLLRWTGSKASYTELVYALCASGVINNGQCEVSQLTAILEEVFNFRCDDIYHIYHRMKTRSEPTKFIDKLKTSFMSVMEASFE